MCVDIGLNEVLGMLTLITALGIACITLKISKKANNILANQAIIDLQKEYNSTEMLTALIKLRNFYSNIFFNKENTKIESVSLKTKDDVEELFEKQTEAIIDFENEKVQDKVKELDKIQKKYRKLSIDYNDLYTKLEKNLKNEKEKIMDDEIINKSLHHKRRMITHFYKHLEANYYKNIIDIEIVHRYWAPEDTLDIIPLILIPIELGFWQKLIKEKGKEVTEELFEKKKENIEPLKKLYLDVLEYENRLKSKPVGLWKKIYNKIDC